MGTQAGEYSDSKEPATRPARDGDGHKLGGSRHPADSRRDIGKSQKPASKGESY